MQDIEQPILAYLARATAGAEGAAALGPETGLVESGLLDSIGLVGLIQFIESEFDVRIPDADMVPELFETPRSVADYVARRLAA